MKKYMKHTEFFEEVSQLADYCDPEVVKKVYYAMIRVISRTIRTGVRVKMPDWGEFYMLNYAPRRSQKVNSGIKYNTEMIKVVKFKPDYKVKDYFKHLQ